LSAPLWGAGEIGKPVVVGSAKGRDTPVVGHLPVETSRISLLATSGSGILLQGASSSSRPAEEEDLQHVVSGVGRLHLAKTRLSECARRKLKRTGRAKEELGAHSNQGTRLHPSRGKPSLGI
jgi:hypothetical protein